MRLEIVWPEHRRIDETEIRTLFSDAVANGKISAEYSQNSTEPEEMARGLHCLGKITLGNGKKE